MTLEVSSTANSNVSSYKETVSNANFVEFDYHIEASPLNSSYEKNNKNPTIKNGDYIIEAKSLRGHMTEAKLDSSDANITLDGRLKNLNIKVPQDSFNEVNKIESIYPVPSDTPQFISFRYANYQDTVITYYAKDFTQLAQATIPAVRCGNWATVQLNDANQNIVSVANCLRGSSWLYYLSIYDPTRKQTFVTADPFSNPTLQNLELGIFGRYLKIASTGNSAVVLDEDPYLHNSFIKQFKLSWNPAKGQYDIQYIDISSTNGLGDTIFGRQLSAAARLDDIGAVNRVIILSAYGEEKMPSGYNDPAIQISFLDEKGIRVPVDDSLPVFTVPGLNAAISDIDCDQNSFNSVRCSIITSSSKIFIVDIGLVQLSAEENSASYPVAVNTWTLSQFEDYFPKSVQISGDTIAVTASNGLQKTVLTYTLTSAPFVFALTPANQQNTNKMFALTSALASQELRQGANPAYNLAVFQNTDGTTITGSQFKI